MSPVPLGGTSPTFTRLPAGMTSRIGASAEGDSLRFRSAIVIIGYPTTSTVHVPLTQLTPETHCQLLLHRAPSRPLQIARTPDGTHTVLGS
jgi:hypothetical protein